jgi:hypothetical protein
MKPGISWAVAAVAAAVLAACSSYGPPRIEPGADADELIPKMGQPTGRYTLPDGNTRLEYARGPFGRHTWMIDVDAENHVLAWSQVLTEQNFNSVKPGIRGDELLLKLGRPSARRHGGFQGGEVWSWRYESVFCQWFQVSVNDAGEVWDAAYGPDPLCDKDRFFRVGHRVSSTKWPLATTAPLA